MAQELSTDGDAPSALELEGRYRPGLVAQVQDRPVQLDLSRSATVYFMRALREPSRSVRSTAKSMSGSYPSRKMGAGIGFESRTIEYPMILTLEHDPDVWPMSTSRQRSRLFTRRAGVRAASCRPRTSWCCGKRGGPDRGQATGPDTGSTRLTRTFSWRSAGGGPVRRHRLLPRHWGSSMKSGQSETSTRSG
jgi:hypothetical protein